MISAVGKRGHLAGVIATILVASALASAQGMGAPEVRPATPPPQILNDISIEQKLNAQVPLDLPFRDENGKTVKLGDYFGKRPLVLALAYYDCPMLCTEVLNGMVSAFQVLKFDMGKQFDVLTVSFDPREKPELARAKKAVYLRRYGRPGGEQGWHFLTGDPPSIAALTNAVGFHYKWDVQTQQFAHATAIMVLTPEGKIAQYYYGVEYSPKDLRLGLVQASAGHIGTVVDQVLLYCYHYDPRTGKYGALISRVLQVAGGITVLLLGGFLIAMFKLPPKNRNASGRAAGSGGR